MAYPYSDVADLASLLSRSRLISRNSGRTDARGRKVQVFEIPHEATVQELFNCLERAVGVGEVSSCQFFTTRNTGKSTGTVEFKTEEAARRSCEFACTDELCLRGSKLVIRPMNSKQIQKDITRIENATLHMGCLVKGVILHELWASDNVTLEVDYFNRRIQFLLTYGRTKYKLEWRFSQIYQVNTCRLREGRRGKALLIKVWLAPKIFEADLYSARSYSLLCEDNEVVWVRTTDFSPDSSIGQAFIYCVEIPEIQSEVLCLLLSKLSELKVDMFPLEERALSIRKGVSYSSSVIVPILSSPYIKGILFELVFLLNSLIQHGYLSGPSLGQDFFQWLQPSAKMPIKHIRYLLNRLTRKQDTCYEPEKWIKSEVRKFQQSMHRIELSDDILDDGLVWIRRVYVTPTRVYFMAPEVEVSNRVIRHFIDSIDNFLRVTFVEEDYENIASTALMIPQRSSLPGSSVQNGHTKVYEHLLSVLNSGLTIGEKRFDFLAFSTSQLRESSVWMFSSNKRTSSESIRNWMGNFLQIKNVAKCAARMGQSFSSSTKSLDVHRYEVEEIPDIWDKTHTYCFSDGIGKISKNFAIEVAEKCRLRRLYGTVPSLYQIRYGGYKGIVAVDREIISKLSLRPSMDKFPSEQIGLDVLNWGKFIPCYLNRQIITLLSTLGVHDAVFERKQMKMMQRLDQMLKNRDVALDVLQMFCGGESHKVMVEMLSAGYGPSSEPFLMRMLHAFRAVQLMDLRKKARVFTPKGRILMGCLDETATLDYGEVFVSVSPKPGNLHKVFDDGLKTVSVLGVDGLTPNVCIVKGNVIVTKNPCVHPGDVRVLRAVDIPSLHHMVDCIAFPQRGPRSHPNECSGSDLDGDLYFVSWDEELIPPEVDPPMDYQPPPQKVLDHAVTIQEIEQYFVDYMINNSLGLICNAHVVFADSEPEKARNHKCLELAKLCSIAVDFPKTGVAAILPAELRPVRYPDFMEKTDKPTYISKGVLGKLYRSVIDKSEDTRTSFFTRREAAKCYDEDLQFRGFEHYLEEAQALKSCYDERLVALMYQYDVKTEAEIFSGNILSMSRWYQKRPGEVKERIQRGVSSLKASARSWMKGEDGFDQTTDFNEELAKASACYHVTYHPDYVLEEDSRHGHLLSFPWVVYDKLLEIKKIKNGL